MKDEVKPEETPTPETPSTQVTDTPKTGDNTHMLLWILLAVAGNGRQCISILDCEKKKIKVNGGAFMSSRSHRCPFE